MDGIKTSMDSTDYNTLAGFHELKDPLQVKRVNDELLEYLFSSLRWLLHYSHKYQIPLPEKDKILETLENIMNVEKKLPPNFKHPNGTPKESIEPKFSNYFDTILYLTRSLEKP